MATSFNCPNCSGPIAFEGRATSVPCPFCGSTVIVPEELRSTTEAGPENVQFLDLSEIMAEMSAGRKINAIKLYRELTNVGLKEAKDAVERLAASGWDVSQQSTYPFQVVTSPAQEAPPTPARTNRLVLIWVLAIFLLAIGGAGIFLFSMGGAVSSLTPILQSSTPVPSPTPFALSALTFGSEGDGPGYLNDARTVAVDSKGRIFVGDYSPGRIQAFTADGTFLWQHLTTGDTDYIFGLAAGLDGKLYAEVGHNIEVFDAGSGQSLAKWELDPMAFGFFDAIAVTPKGEVLAVMERELLKFDSQGKLLLQLGSTQDEFLKKVGVKEGSQRIVGMAVDGSGDIYIGLSGNFILKLAENGSLIDRLNGVEANGSSIYAISVDGQGRIAWGYSNSIVVTDSEGRYQGEFEVPFMRDMEYGIQGQLVAVHLSVPLVHVYTFGDQ